MSLIRTADSAMNSVSNILLRMRDIANQSANGTNTKDNQAALQKEFGELQNKLLISLTTLNSMIKPIK